jgi:hypothetical protein
VVDHGPPDQIVEREVTGLSTMPWMRSCQVDRDLRHGQGRVDPVELESGV